jgi:hypothetical protein
MVKTRSQNMAEATPIQVLEKLVPLDQQVKGKERKHYVYFAEGNALVLVSLFKRSKWGLVLIDKTGKVHQGQYVKHKIHPRECGFDGTHFYWDAYIDYFFVIGKSIAPYFTAVEPTQWTDGYGFDPVTGKPGHNGWGGVGKAGGAHDVMYDLTSLTWDRIPAPYPGALRK